MMKKLIWYLLIGAMVIAVLGGCGKSETVQTDSTQKEAGGTEAGSGEAGGNGAELSAGKAASMGRYVEHSIDISEQLTSAENWFSVIEDHVLTISDEKGTFLVSGDGGDTWQQEKGWKEELPGDPYLFEVKTGPDGTFYILYNVSQQEGELQSALLVISPDGTKKEVSLPVQEDESYVRHVWISDENRVFVSTLGANIYEVTADGSLSLFLTLEYRYPQLVQFQENLMVIDAGSRYPGLFLYDMEQKNFIEDPVLQEFVQENYSNRDSGGSWYEMFYFFGEEKVLYLAGEKGLHRHVIGGSTMEQVIDGRLSTFGNPAYSLCYMTALPENEFLAWFNGEVLIRYTYDPDMPTVPAEKLTVYSLEENDLVRQAIALYQTENPGVLVEYQIGMSKEDAVTKEDAIKSLNTRLMAGDGPDVLLLDGLPWESYREKGLLKDLTPLLDSLEGEDAIFPNVTEGFLKEGQICTVACEIKLPALVCEDKYLSRMTDLEGVADGVIEMRKDYPSVSLVNTISPKGIMSWLAMTSAPAWKGENKTIDYEAVSEFLVQAKRVYDAQMDGLSEEFIEWREELSKILLAESGMEAEDSSYFRIGLNELGLIGGDQKLLCGSVYSAYNYNAVCSIPMAEGFSQVGFSPMPGQGGNVFYAETLLAVHELSENQQQAEDFVRLMLGKENQSSTYNGLPVNQAAFEESFQVQESQLGENGSYGTICSENTAGEFVELNIYWADEEQVKALKQWLESRTVAYVENERLEAAVYEEGTDFMLGKQSLEEALAGIEEKVALYLAE